MFLRDAGNYQKTNIDIFTAAIISSHTHEMTYWIFNKKNIAVVLQSANKSFIYFPWRLRHLSRHGIGFFSPVSTEATALFLQLSFPCCSRIIAFNYRHGEKGCPMEAMLQVHNGTLMYFGSTQICLPRNIINRVSQWVQKSKQGHISGARYTPAPAVLVEHFRLSGYSTKGLLFHFLLLI
jgi:hypothetical protein